MRQHEVFLGLGGNIGNTRKVLLSAIECIRDLDEVSNLQLSPLYLTSPVSSIPQGIYVNAVCRFETSEAPEELWPTLQAIELQHGKQPKAKDEPRVLDIDIILWGQETRASQDLTIPHAHWQERLFVLAPLADLTKSVVLPDGICYDVKEAIARFPDHRTQWAHRLDEANVDSACR